VGAGATHYPVTARARVGRTASDTLRVTIVAPPAAGPAPPDQPPAPLPPLAAPHPSNYWFVWWGLILSMLLPLLFRQDEFRVKYPVPEGAESGSPCDPPAATGGAAAGDVGELRAVCQRSCRAQIWFPLGLVACATLFTVHRLAFPTNWQPTADVAMYRPLWLARRLGIVMLVAYIGLVLLHLLGGAEWLSRRNLYLLPASWSVFLLVGLLTAVAWQFTRWSLQRAYWLYPVVFIFFLFPFLIPLFQTNYRLPAMEVYEPDPQSGADRPAGSYYDVGSRPNLAEYQFHRKDPAGLVPDAEALEAWNQRLVGRYGTARPAVVVSVSGGASASALYTAEVLFTLEHEHPGLTDQIRVIGGASGGMFGAAYFVAQCRPHTALAKARTDYAAAWKACFFSGTIPRAEYDRAEAAYKQLVLAARQRARDDLGQDFLSPLMQQWVHKDIPLYFLPLKTTNDRGRALELTWARALRGPVRNRRTGEVADGGVLEVPFTDLREEERAGEIPSLIFTPMMLEDGRQLIISNLDLDYMVDSSDARQQLPGVPPEKPSHTGVEFYRLFPKARGFRLGTAVRMNASFPYLSPSAAIPTNPERHVVDAGYYDNYGTITATRWIMRQVDWLNTTWWKAAGRPDWVQTPAVYLIQVRCFAYETQTRQFVTQAESREVVRVGPGGVARTESGLFTVTAPLHGLFASWKANMVYRGDERVEAARTFTRRSYVDPSQGDSALYAGVRTDRVLFECPFAPSLNWLLTDAERRRLADGGAGMIEPDFAKLRQAFPAAKQQAEQQTEAMVRPWQAAVGAAVVATIAVPVRLWREPENGDQDRTAATGRREFYWRLLAQQEGVSTANPTQ
jgi:hypothetical protein